MDAAGRHEVVVADVFVGTIGALRDTLTRTPRTVASAILKQRVEGPVRVRALGLEGDERADRTIHRNPDRAVLAYPTASYPLWRRDLGDARLEPGGFGENLAVDGVTEADVCIGDVVRAGTALLQVTQPRNPCRKPDIRWGIDGLSRLMKSTGRTGWLLRVLEEGEVEAGAALELVERPHPEWTIDDVTRVAWRDARPGEAEELARCPALVEQWRRKIAERVDSARA